MQNANVVDALIEIGNERRRILAKIKEAVEKHDLDLTFRYAELLVGIREREEANDKKQ
jgi:hypothetical protein